MWDRIDANRLAVGAWETFTLIVHGPTGSDEGWKWVSSNPSPYSGAVSHQSNNVSGLHQHYFWGATQTLQVNAGDRLYTYVYLDSANLPSEVMLQWYENGSWEHRAYWGANNIGWGADGTASRLNMGSLPPAGQWVRLEVEASAVGLGGKTLNGMAFTLDGGRASWDKTGKTAPPTVKSFSPAAGATNVNLGANMTVTFSKAMNPATVNGSTVELRDPSNALVPTTLSYNADSFTATLALSAPLSQGVTYTARVRGGGTDPRVKDVEGNALAADVTWTFTTRSYTNLSLNMALIDPNNGIGSPGEDLLSRNCNWSLPLLALPGRAGLDLGLALSLNSLVYTRAGSVMYFDPNQEGYPAPGFRLGFPEIRNAFTNTEAGAQSYLLSMPSGRRVEFRQTNTNVYEAVDSSYMLLTHDPVNSVFILYTTDGTQCRFVDVTGSGDYKCVQIKDRQGNYITIGYGSLAEIRTVTETLGRVINFNYGVSNHLDSITQNWGGQTHTWATFTYGTQTIQTNFPGLTLNGTANGAQKSVLTRVGLADGSVYSFEYNTYCQVKTIRRYAPNDSNPVNFPGDYFQLAYTTYGLPDNANNFQTDCPRITSRTNWASDWNSGVTSTYDADPGLAWGKVTFPDGTIYKEFFATTGWQRGLTTQTENWSGGVRKKWATLQWTQDNTVVVYRLNPRVTETIVNDDANNRRRTTMSYTNFGLVADIKEYDANTTTVLRHMQTDYNLSAVYTDRRIIGLPSAQYLKDGNDTLFSKVTYVYDLNPNPNPYLQHPGPTTQHDTANYGSGFVQGRGNLNRKLRWDATDPTNATKASQYETGYNTSGSVIFTRDPLDHQTDVSYDDSFSDEQNRNTYAYPTTMTVTDPNTISSTVQYNYDFGAVTRTQNPKGAAVTRTYDAAGRIERTTNVVNGAYTRYVYAPDQRQVESFTTIKDLNPANEFRTVTVFDGRGRTRGVASEHPGSVGGYKAQIYEYDIMGRLARQTNPTEITNPTGGGVNWTPAGDDEAAGLVWSYQSYDWQNRPTVYTNQDGTTRSISYNGCGCAGGQVVTFIDEMQRKRDQTYDVLGRLWRERTYYDNIGTPEPYDLYTTTTNTYNVRDQITNITVDSLGESQNTVMTYDGHGRLKTGQAPIYLGNPQSATPYTSYEYYKDDMVMSVTDPRGAGVTYSYNNRGLVTNLSYSVPSGVASTPNVSFGYDEVGSRLWMDDGPGRIDYEYNLQGALKKETRLFDELPAYQYELSYEYNLQNQLRSVTTRRNGAVDTALNFDYDRSGRLATVYGSGYGGGNPFYFTSPSSPIKYRAWDATKQITYGNNRTMNVSYNGRLQTAGVEMPGLMSVTYVYNYDGRIAQIDDDWQQPDPYYPSLSRRIKARYNYDDVGRVNNTDDFYAPFHQHFMLYNGFDNLTYTSKGMGPAVPIADYLTTFVNNRDQSSDMEYDQAGQMTRIKSAQYSFDAVGRPTSQSDINLSLWYDGDGLQIKHTQSNSQASFTRYFLRSSAMGGKVLAELNQNGDKIYNYLKVTG